MPRLGLDLVIAATGGALARGGATAFEGVTHDGRAVPKGGLYFAIRGERVDGHEFVGQAEQAGAAGVVVARGQGQKALEGTKRAVVLEVDDPLLALGRLARAHRRAMQVKVVALTGSVGKTSTKEMMASIFAAAVGDQAVHKTKGNLNNHLGVPLTLLGIEEHHRVAVVELGMSSLGEIAYLEQLARPDVAVVTQVAGVHLEQLQSLENVGRAKGEILEGQASTGAAWAVYPYGEALLADSLARVPSDRRRTFGAAGATVEVRSALVDGSGTLIELMVGGRPLELKLPLLGAHQAHNAACAVAVATVLGVGEQAILSGLASVKAEKHRMQLVRVKGRTVIDDCYNASPPSMRAALDALHAFGKDGARKVAILGDMLELGPGGPAEHAAIGRYAAARATEIIALGALSKDTVAGALETLGPEQAVHVADADAAAQRALQATKSGDVLLVKGSRGMKLEQVIEAMEKHAGGKG